MSQPIPHAPKAFELAAERAREAIRDVPLGEAKGALDQLYYHLLATLYQRALDEEHGAVTRAAEALRVGASPFKRMLKKLGLSEWNQRAHRLAERQPVKRREKAGHGAPRPCARRQSR